MIPATSPVRAVVRLRTLGPSGLNPPQTKVIDRLQTLSQAEESPIADLDVDIWGASMGITQTDNRDPGDTRDRVAEFAEWADEHDCTLRPAFDWRSADSPPEDQTRQQISTPLITLAVYSGSHLQAVYPHMDGDEVYTIHDGIKALESLPRETEQRGDEETEEPPVIAQ